MGKTKQRNERRAQGTMLVGNFARGGVMAPVSRASRVANLSSVSCIRGSSLRQVGVATAGRTPRNVARVVIEEKKRMYNRARKSACKTRMKRVLTSVEDLKENKPSAAEDLKPVDALIALAYKEIDRAVSKGVMHKKTAAKRKARVAKARRDLAISAGLYTP